MNCQVFADGNVVITSSGASYNFGGCDIINGSFSVQGEPLDISRLRTLPSFILRNSSRLLIPCSCEVFGDHIEAETFVCVKDGVIIPMSCSIINGVTYADNDVYKHEWSKIIECNLEVVEQLQTTKQAKVIIREPYAAPAHLESCGQSSLTVSGLQKIESLLSLNQSTIICNLEKSNCHVTIDASGQSSIGFDCPVTATCRVRLANQSSAILTLGPTDVNIELCNQSSLNGTTLGCSVTLNTYNQSTAIFTAPKAEMSVVTYDQSTARVKCKEYAEAKSYRQSSLVKL